MAEGRSKPVGDFDASKARGHEVADISVRGIAIAAGILVISAAVIHVLLYYVFGLYGAVYPQRPAPPVTARQVPPPPRLQASPQLDWAQFEREQRRLLSSYGWVDRRAGVARIPIDEAMHLLLQRGLPVRPAPQQQKAERDVSIDVFTAKRLSEEHAP